MKTTNAAVKFVVKTIEDALEGCKQGKVNDSLRMLYNAPLREAVPWTQFPAWARPNDPVEGCHEG